MFDLTKSQQIFYGEDQFITVYGDHDDANKYYIVPAPRLVTQGGQPVFSLTKYKTNQGGVSGYCTFDVELYIPDEARAAAEAKLGAGIVWGQFDWVGGDVLFKFDMGIDTI